MTAQNIELLQHICNTVPTLLRNFSEEEFSYKQTAEKWSKKEILGHLIDSATINHHRFVRAQYESIPTISYDQNKWIVFNYYNQVNSEQLIQFWMLYNRQLIELVTLISSADLAKECNTGEQNNVLWSICLTIMLLI
jgi:hypothetical protein